MLSFEIIKLTNFDIFFLRRILILVNTLISKQTAMEGSSNVLQLYKLIREKKQITKLLPVINGPGSVKNGRATLKGKALISPGLA